MDKSYFDVKPSGRHAQVLSKPVADALMEFCGQEPEFEQAIVQSGKSFDDCLKEITKGIGGAISDLEVYSRAVKFYFPVAAVRFHMTIDLCGNNCAADPPITQHKQEKPMNLSLDSLLDF